MRLQRSKFTLGALFGAAAVLASCGTGYSGPYVPSTTGGSSLSPLANQLEICLLPGGMQPATSNCSKLGDSPAYIPSVDLGNVTIGQTSWVQLNIQNNGSTDLLLAPLAFEGTPPPGLTIVGGWSASQTLPASQTLSVFLYFEATAADPMSFLATLDFTFEGSLTPAVKMPVFALVGAAGGCSGSPPTPSFVVEQNGGLIATDPTTGAYDFEIPSGSPNITVNFDASATTPATGVQFLWSVLSTTNNATTQFSSTDGANTSIEVTQAGIYAVGLTVSSDNGACVAPMETATLSVTAG